MKCIAREITAGVSSFAQVEEEASDARRRPNRAQLLAAASQNFSNGSSGWLAIQQRRSKVQQLRYGNHQGRIRQTGAGRSEGEVKLRMRGGGTMIIGGRYK